MRTGAVRCYSFFEATGHGLAAISYVRGLLNAGVPVHWIPLVYVADRWVPLATAPQTQALNGLAQDDVALADLPALLAATAWPVDCDTVLAHTWPELWPEYFEAGKRNVGYVAWEANAIPGHWKPLLDLADAACVPSEFNRAALVAAGIRPSVHVVPHIRRHAWNEVEQFELQTMRQGLGIDPGDFVFYSINRWDTRKNHALLLRAYLHAFQAGEPVVLVLKTTPMGVGGAPDYLSCSSADLAQAVITEIATSLPSPPAKVCLLPYELSGRGIDMLHTLGDCYVSTSHGEGWGIGAFDAATRATPVIMPRWSGPLDFLGSDWPGAIDVRLVPPPIHPPRAPSHWSSQRWAEPDFGATVRALRQAYEDPDPGRQAAARWASDIANRFAEPVVTDQLLAAIDG